MKRIGIIILVALVSGCTAGDKQTSVTQSTTDRSNPDLVKATPEALLLPSTDLKVEQSPIINGVSDNSFTVESNAKVQSKTGLSVTVEKVMVVSSLHTVVLLKLRLKNDSEKPLRISPILGNIVIENRQLDVDSIKGDLSGTIEPGVLKEGSIDYLLKDASLDLSNIKKIRVNLDDVSKSEPYEREKIAFDLLIPNRSQSSAAKKSVESPKPVLSSGVLVASDPKSPINVRDEANTSSFARHVGYAGDKVQILEEKTDSKGQMWYRVTFSSQALGWIRGDFISVQ